MRFKSIALLLIVLLSTLPLIPTAAETGSGRFELTACPFIVLADIKVECGYLTVPENRDDANSPMLRLAVGILRSRSASPLPDPVIYLEGGPGGSALADIYYWFDSPILDQRDIILLDQRGTGFSEPFLGCDYDDYAFGSGLSSDEACRDALVARGVNLAMYNSAASAADMNDLRVALGIEQWNLYGISYGTRLALTAMRDYPQGIRSVVLDSVYPPEIGGYIDQARNGYRAFSMLFKDCAADRECAAAFPDLEATFYRTVERLNRDPGSYVDPYGESWSYYGDDLINELFGLMYDSEAIPYLPMMLHELSKGDYNHTYASLLYADMAEYEMQLKEALAAMPDWGLAELLAYYEFATLEALFVELPQMSLQEYDELAEDIFFFRVPPDERNAAMMAQLGISNPEEFQKAIEAMSADEYYDLIQDVFFPEKALSFSDGMYNSVECFEEMPFNPYPLVVSTTERVGMPDSLEQNFLLDIEAELAMCKYWGAGTATEIENAPVVSAIPTLVMAGSYDPITPPAWAQSAARHLSNSHFYIYPGLGHGVTIDSECATAMMLEFLDRPAAAPNDSCLLKMGSPDFVTQ